MSPITSIASFTTPEDIANRALNHLGQDHSITSIISDNSKTAGLVKGVYARLRQSELRRNCWNFATRRSSNK